MGSTGNQFNPNQRYGPRSLHVHRYIKLTVTEYGTGW